MQCHNLLTASNLIDLSSLQCAEFEVTSSSLCDVCSCGPGPGMNPRERAVCKDVPPGQRLKVKSSRQKLACVKKPKAKPYAGACLKEWQSLKLSHANYSRTVSFIKAT